ncbi:TetR/AcrR family transcriptional regulator [Lysobacter soli]|uniref:TetR/AcrR family transcriptional regulator n=1 Tax=Lysobacter soli TaxID=453783 RepID=UPI0037C88686
MPAPLLSREAVVDRLLGAFRRFGYDAASLGQLSSATGLGRSSLYHYFPGGKEEMARAVLDRVDQWVQESVLSALRASGTPERRLSQVIAALDDYYDGGTEACLFGNFVVGDAVVLFHDRLSAAFHQLINGLTLLAREKGIPAREAQRRAEDAVVRIQGGLIISRGMGDPAPFRRVLKELAQHLLG